MIRKFQKTDARQVMKIWLNSNEEAHAFIAKEYWQSNFDRVQGQLMEAEVFVCERDGEIQGFIGIVDNYIAGIFVDKIYRSLGVGKGLLDYAKQKYDTLSLDVYEKNKRAVDFYLREGFSVLSKEVDSMTGEIEYTMIWNCDDYI